ncbi:flavin reductase [Micromonospora sp. NBS 11-29]|uniref:flavin reductase n=1 Tax=Micromonospora sp. NBS 11-29 TaxID=1960879 RepID=UPI000B791EAA|nr:flavin reductase [Micromonospora sp. NBS 11-29]
MSIHQPIKPAWTCGGCVGEWPCQVWRCELRTEYDDAPASLALYLAAQLVDANRHLDDIPADRLYRRFLGWIR